jgi:PBSX family phage terminase large subunit
LVKTDFKVNLTDRQELGRRILMEQNHYTDIMFDGGARSGKTFLIVLCLIFYLIAFPGIRILASRMMLSHAIASLWKQTIIPLIDQLGIRANINLSSHTVTIGKSELWLGGLDSRVQTEKVLGQEFAIIFLNEAVEIPQSIRDILKTRLAQKVKGLNNFMIYDCNPRQPTHYLFKEFYVDKNSDRKVLKFLPIHNKENLPAGYIEKTLMNLPEDKQARFLRGEWVYLPGAVYRNIKESNIITCEKNLYKFYDDFTIGVDWGLHMCANIWGIKVAQPKIQAYCIHEIIIMNGVTKDLIDEFGKIFGIKEKNIIEYCDHEPDRILELQNSGYMAKPAYKDIGPGDSSVNEYEIFFDKACKYTFDSMANLQAPESPMGGFIYGKHIKENDHEADAGRYGLHGWKMDNNVKGAGHHILKGSLI